tara:strand:+ start:644 stop:745 length:102 start_codon:yes stop_codon:yes gene_type:complete
MGRIGGWSLVKHPVAYMSFGKKDQEKEEDFNLN